MSNIYKIENAEATLMVKPDLKAIDAMCRILTGLSMEELVKKQIDEMFRRERWKRNRRRYRKAYLRRNPTARKCQWSGEPWLTCECKRCTDDVPF